MSKQIIFLAIKLVSIIILAGFFFILYKRIFGCSDASAFGLTIPSLGLLIVIILNVFKKEYIALKLGVRVLSRKIIRKMYFPFVRLREKRSEQNSSLSLTEIQKDGVIKEINCPHITVSKNDLEVEFARHCLIKKSKTKGSARTIHIFDYEKFFDLEESYLKHKLFFEFCERYREKDFHGLGILSAGKSDYKRIFTTSSVSKEEKIKTAIKETIYWDDIVLERNRKNLFSNLPVGSKIILLQLMEEGNGFLEKAYEFTNSNSNVQVIGLLTFFNPLSNEEDIRFNDIEIETLVRLKLK